MTRMRRNRQNPIPDLACIMVLLSFLLMIAFANPFNPLPFMVSIIGLGVGLYITVLQVCPKEAKYWRNFLLDKLNLVFNLPKEPVQKHRKKKRKRIC